LGEVGSVTAQLASVVFIITGVMLMIYGYNLHKILGKNGKSVGSGILLMLFGFLDFVGSGLFPVDIGGASNTMVATIHVYATLIGELAAVGMPIWFLRDTKDSDGWDKHRRFSRVTFWLSLPIICFLGYCIVGHTPGMIDTPIGLAQRLLIGLYLIWISASTIDLRKN
jgi:hypothetical protein